MIELVGILFFRNYCNYCKAFHAVLRFNGNYNFHLKKAEVLCNTLTRRNSVKNLQWPREEKNQNNKDEMFRRFPALNAMLSTTYIDVSFTIHPSIMDRSVECHHI